MNTLKQWDILSKSFLNPAYVRKGYLYSAAFWLFVGLVLSFGTELLLFFKAPVPGLLDYGHLKPLVWLCLGFGCFYSFTWGLSYDILFRKSKGEQGHPFFIPAIALICLKLKDIAILLASVAILLGFNKGRDFGEMPWLMDQIFFLSLWGLPIVILLLFSLKSLRWDNSNPDFTIILLLVSAAGTLFYYILGNFTIPLGFLTSAPVTTGVEDMTIQALYTNGLLLFSIVTPVLALLYYYVPIYYKVELYSTSIPRFYLASLLLLSPFAAAVSLVYTVAPVWMQNVGVFTSIALHFALLAGGLNVHYTLSKSKKRFVSDYIGILLRFSLFFLLTFAILRAILALPFLQAYFTYSSFAPSDLSFNLKAYALIAVMALAIIVWQEQIKRAFSRRLLGFICTFWIIGVLLFVPSSFLTAIFEANQVTAMQEASAIAAGKDTQGWGEVFFSTKLFIPADVGSSAFLSWLLSSRGLALLGELCFFIASLVFIFYAAIYMFFAKKYRPAKPYALPDLNAKSSEASPGPSFTPIPLKKDITH